MEEQQPWQSRSCASPPPHPSPHRPPSPPPHPDPGPPFLPLGHPLSHPLPHLGPPPTRRYRFSLWFCTPSYRDLSHPSLLALLTSLPVIVDGQPLNLRRPPTPGFSASLPFITASYTNNRWLTLTHTHPTLGTPHTLPWTVFSYPLDLPDPLPSYGSWVAFRRESAGFVAIEEWLGLTDVTLVQVGGSRLLPHGRVAKLWTSTYGMHISGGEPLDPQLGTHFLCIDDPILVGGEAGRGGGHG